MVSVLRLAMFFLIFHLMILIVNHIEIAPGYHLETGQIEPFISHYDPMEDIYKATSNMNTSMAWINGVSFNGSYMVVPVCLTTLKQNFCINAPVNPTAELDILGSSFVYGPIIVLLVMLNALIFSFISMAISFILLIIVLILMVTVGAIPFWITIFSFIDPTLGLLLGTVIGGIQMVYISIGIFTFVSAMIAGVSRFL
jgi:hypothetical protein